MVLALYRQNKFPGIGQMFRYTLRDESNHIELFRNLFMDLVEENREIWTPEFKEELRQNLLDRLRDGRPRFPGIVGYPQPDGAVKLAAGWLIEHAGWKGRRIGDAAVYERQALVLVNLGNATSADVIGLARAIQADVRARYAVDLEPEPVWT
jgi:UDP-N-acetylenolpyruvoylglucosamine reductase